MAAIRSRVNLSPMPCAIGLLRYNMGRTGRTGINFSNCSFGGFELSNVDEKIMAPDSKDLLEQPVPSSPPKDVIVRQGIMQ